jgi:hypothetical protein
MAYMTVGRKFNRYFQAHLKQKGAMTSHERAMVVLLFIL